MAVLKRPGSARRAKHKAASTTIAYTPRGTDGFACSLRAGSENLLSAELSGSGVEPVVDGGDELLANPAVVRNLLAYAQHELDSRRKRSPEQRASHREAAARHRALSTGLADMVGRLDDESVTGWCSGCFELAEHREVEGRTVPQQYLCDSCGACTSACAVPRCDHFAIRSLKQASVPSFCAEHRHDIPGFEKLDDRFEHIDDYREWLEYEARNAKRLTLLAAGIVASASVVTPFALTSAPAIGGAIGSWAGLSGAAATSHGLALLGGGSVAAGGFGMAGGVVVVAAAGAGVGSAMGAAVTSAYVGADDSFSIDLVAEGVGTPVLFIKGFLTEGDVNDEEWLELIRARYPEAPVYRVRWGSKELGAIARLIGNVVAKEVVRDAVVAQALRAAKAAASKIGPLVGLAALSSVAKNPWWVAHARAEMTGAVLADLIARTTGEPFVLVGHSLGARVAVSAAQVLGTRTDVEPRIESMHLLGAAVPAGEDWHSLDRAVSGRVYNYWSENDRVLGIAYRGAQWGRQAVGVVGFDSSFANIVDRNVSRRVASHSGYVTGVRLAQSC